MIDPDCQKKVNVVFQTFSLNLTYIPDHIKVRQHLSGAASHNSRFLAIQDMVFVIYILG